MIINLKTSKLHNLLDARDISDPLEKPVHDLLRESFPYHPKNDNRVDIDLPDLIWLTNGVVSEYEASGPTEPPPGEES